MSSDAGVGIGGEERRLHPLSWLFVLIQQLKSFALPLLVLLLGGRGNSWELYGLVGVAALALLSLAQYFTYRFRVDRDGLVVRSGLFQRSLRHIPYQRVQNVALHQTVLHRLFGVAEVRLESAAGGIRPEAEMRVLSLADAQALEALVRSHGDDAAAVADGAAAPAARTLLQLSTAEIVRQGLISNRGMVVVGTAIALVFQSGGDDFARTLISSIGRKVFGWGQGLHLGYLGWTLGVLAALLLAVVAMRAFSVAYALVKLHGFELSEAGRRLSVQHGLLTRRRANMPRDRIQAWTVQESLVHRWLRRRSVQVDSANVESGGEQRSLRDLAPVITADAGDALVRHLLPGATWPPAEWKPLHPRAWRRQFALPALAIVAITAVLCFREGAWALLVLALLPVFALRARVWARHAGYSVGDGLVAVREGWLDRTWRFAEVRKVQALMLRSSPFDRRNGMATLVIDTAGASPFSPPLRIRYLPAAEAQALHARLAAALAARITPARTAASAAPAA